jgi:hypothetical protein
MRVIRDDGYGDIGEYWSIERYAQAKLDGDACYRGVTEAATATAQNTSEALGRLLDILAAKGMVTAADVEHIIEDSYSVTLTFGMPDNE